MWPGLGQKVLSSSSTDLAADTAQTAPPPGTALISDRHTDLSASPTFCAASSLRQGRNVRTHSPDIAASIPLSNAPGTPPTSSTQSLRSSLSRVPSAVTPTRTPVSSKGSRRKRDPSSLDIPDRAGAPITSSVSTTRSKRRQLLREAVKRRSGIAAQPRGSLNPEPLVSEELDPSGHSYTGHQQVQVPHSPITPLFPPTTLIIGDSIIRNICFANATTCCYPGATVSVILDKLLYLLPELPPTIIRIIIHVGANEIRRRESELTKKDFLLLFDILKKCDKSIYISGLLPSINQRSERFSRALALHLWLQDMCIRNDFIFIDNFNLFWNRPSFFQSDGIHPNINGSRIFASNLQYVVQTTPK
uniref:SGNH hydrolase-type esterase domain-containing protein n=1 Tax=Oryzias melastigma TaxID=30732 RepID=A0A3B3CSV3_ORYME